MENNKYIEAIKEFTLLDDTFMRVVFNDSTLVEFLIRIILKNGSLKVEDINIQADYKNLRGRSCILDIVAKDSKGYIYNIEIQRGNSGASAKRARYHSSLLDVNTSCPYESLDKLPNTYIIFITENDIFRKNEQLYEITRVIKETGEEFCDGTHILYVNSSKCDESSIGKLMHDFRCKNPNDMYYEQLSEHTRFYKETQKGLSRMCKVMDKLIQEEKPTWIQEGMQKGLEQGKIEGKNEGKIEGKIEGAILIYRDDLKLNKKDALLKIIEKFNINESEAREYIDKYYK